MNQLLQLRIWLCLAAIANLTENEVVSGDMAAEGALDLVCNIAKRPELELLKGHACADVPSANAPLGSTLCCQCLVTVAPCAAVPVPLLLLLSTPTDQQLATLSPCRYSASLSILCLPVAETARALRNFVANEAVHELLAESDTLTTLLALARTEDTEVQAYAVWAIEVLSGIDQFQTAIVNDGGLEVLMSLAHSSSPEVFFHMLCLTGFHLISQM